jgi:hypothetical protein
MVRRGGRITLAAAVAAAPGSTAPASASSPCPAAFAAPSLSPVVSAASSFPAAIFAPEVIAEGARTVDVARTFVVVVVVLDAQVMQRQRGCSRLRRRRLRRVLRPATYCSLRHPPHSDPSFLELYIVSCVVEYSCTTVPLSARLKPSQLWQPW